MKKTLLQWGAITAICATLFVFGSCGETEYDARTDTIVTLDTPEVTAIAYPGVNVIYWEPVTGAANYTVTIRHEDGATEIRSSSEKRCYITDTELENGKNYTYCVVANVDNTSSIVARAVYAQSSDRGEASVRAIVPPAGTKALDLVAYEGGYDGEPKTVSEDDKKYVLDANSITADKADDKIVVTFPMKVYLDYTVRLLNNDFTIDEVATGVEDGEDVNSSAKFANNTTARFVFDITNSGEYKVSIRVKSKNEEIYE